MKTPIQLGMHTKEFAWLTLAGIPAFVFCGLSHICMAGHMQHGPYRWWHFALDLQWFVFLITAAIRVRGSDLHRSRRLCWLLVSLVIARGLLGSLGGGLLILFELPVTIYLVITTIRSLWRLREDGSMVRDAAPHAI